MKARVGNGSTTHNIWTHLYSKRRPAWPGVETTERSGLPALSPRRLLCPFKRVFLFQVTEHFFPFPAFPAGAGEAEGSCSPLTTLKVFLRAWPQR